MKVDVEDVSVAYAGYLKVKKYRLRHERFDGGMSRPIEREVVDRGAIAAVLPYDPVADAVVLIEQFRPGAHAAGHGAWLQEIIAGVVEPGETPEDMARREAMEEAGLALADLVPVAGLFLTPGICTEFCNIYCAVCDSSAAGGLHGHADEGEDIRAAVHPFAEVEAMVRDGRVSNAITAIALQWLMLNRKRLRAGQD